MNNNLSDEVQEYSIKSHKSLLLSLLNNCEGTELFQQVHCRVVKLRCILRQS